MLEVSTYCKKARARPRTPQPVTPTTNSNINSSQSPSMEEVEHGGCFRMLELGACN